MKRFLAASLLFLPGALAPLVPACSSQATPTQGSNGDASDDAHTTTTNPVGTSDAAYADDVGLGTGLPDVPSVAPPVVTCATSSDCLSLGEVCGFAANGGCAVKGVCVFGAPPTDSNGLTESACGCTGETVLYVAPNYTALPVASPNACGVGGDAGPNVDASSSDGGPTDSGADSSALLGCIGSGGTPASVQCCASAGSYPDSCNVGACSCSLANSVGTLVCDCPAGMCFSAAQAKCVSEQ